jgi:hypothetical protein
MVALFDQPQLVVTHRAPERSRIRLEIVDPNDKAAPAALKLGIKQLNRDQTVLVRLTDRLAAK